MIGGPAAGACIEGKDGGSGEDPPGTDVRVDGLQSAGWRARDAHAPRLAFVPVP